MAMFCSIWGCSDEVVDFYGKKGEYVLYRCKKCGKETIFCSKESKILGNDAKGKKALEMMMNDREFSKQCTIHSEFMKAESDYPFNFVKQEKVKDQIREKYGLPAGYHQPDPAILLDKGLWRGKPQSTDGENKPKKDTKPKPKKKTGEKPLKLEAGENDNYDNVVKVEIRITNKNDKTSGDDNKGGEKYESWIEMGTDGNPKEELSVEAQISRLERRMNKHVAREEYEKAAKLRDQIFKLKGEK